MSLAVVTVLEIRAKIAPYQGPDGAEVLFYIYLSLGFLCPSSVLPLGNVCALLKSSAPFTMPPWFGHASTTFYGSQDSVSLPARTPGAESVSLLSLVKEATPPCNLNPLLFNGDLQTFWTAVKPADIPIYYKRHIFEHEDPRYAGTFTVDFVAKPSEDIDSSLPHRTTYYTDGEFDKVASEDERPMVVILHGLAGGSDEVYLRATLKPLIDAGWEACVVNSRGCAMSKITSSVLYNARATWDVRQTVKWLRKTFSNRSLFGLGFSLGANILTNVSRIDRLKGNRRRSDLLRRDCSILVKKQRTAS